MVRTFTPEETAAWQASLDRRWSSSHVAVVAKEKVLVVKANYLEYWTFPGGIVDKGETPLEAGVREVSEEVGMKVSPDELAFRFIAHRTSPRMQTFQFVFETHQDSVAIDQLTLDGQEIEDVRQVTREEIIGDSKNYSASTVLWAEGFTGYAEQTIGV